MLTAEMTEASIRSGLPIGKNKETIDVLGIAVAPVELLDAVGDGVAFCDEAAATRKDRRKAARIFAHRLWCRCEI